MNRDSHARAFSIAYVEDNEHLRETIGALLEAEGREVLLYPDAESALAAFAQRRFDLVITDITLPGQNGIELARLLLRDDPGAWVVLCSGYGFGAELDGLGANVRSLRKPFEFDQLEALIAAADAARG